MTAHTFVVPGEPRGWERARAMATGKGVRFFTSPEQRARQGAIQWCAKAGGIVLAPEGEPIGVDVVASWLYPRAMSERKVRDELARLAASPAYLGLPKITRPDIDNAACKDVLDSLNGIAWHDDGQVAMMRAAKVWGPVAATFVRLWTGDAPAFPMRWWT